MAIRKGTPRSAPETLGQKRAQIAIDAYNAGWRRGKAGQPATSPRYERHEQFAVGYADGQKAAQ